jgi:hypothetical protein
MADAGRAQFGLVRPQYRENILGTCKHGGGFAHRPNLLPGQ